MTTLSIEFPFFAFDPLHCSILFHLTKELFPLPEISTRAAQMQHHSATYAAAVTFTVTTRKTRMEPKLQVMETNCSKRMD